MAVPAPIASSERLLGVTNATPPVPIFFTLGSRSPARAVQACNHSLMLRCIALSSISEHPPILVLLLTHSSAMPARPAASTLRGCGLWRVCWLATGVSSPPAATPSSVLEDSWAPTQANFRLDPAVANNPLCCEPNVSSRRWCSVPPVWGGVAHEHPPTEVPPSSSRPHDNAFPATAGRCQRASQGAESPHSLLGSAMQHQGSRVGSPLASCEGYGIGRPMLQQGILRCAMSIPTLQAAARLAQLVGSDGTPGKSNLRVGDGLPNIAAPARDPLDQLRLLLLGPSMILLSRGPHL
eukprot:2428126-Amphidinium_carterae.4